MKTRVNADKNAENSVEKLEKENRVLKELLVEALHKIKKLEDLLKKHEQPDSDYNKAWTVVTKIVFLVTKAEKPLRSSEIIQLLKQQEPSIVNKQESIEKYVSAFLNTAVKHKRLITQKLNGVRGYYYCIPDWVNEDGELKREMKAKIF